MAKLAAKQVEEINAIITAVEKAIKPGAEIGARDKAVLTTLLKSKKSDQKATFFACKREYSDAIVSHFVREKGVVKSTYSVANQSAVFVLG